MARLNDVEVENVLSVDYVLLLENADVSVDVQILQVLLPLVEANHLHDRHQNFLQTLVGAVQTALDDNLVVIRKDFVSF